ncbi:MAG: ATP-binding protein [Candidatus Hydrogenedentota bacterium]
MDDAEKIVIKIPGKSKYLSSVRRVTEEITTTLKFSEEDVNRIKLCVDEAVTNIIRHCYKGDCNSPIEISFQPNSSRLVIEIIDYGPKVDVSKIRPRDLDDIRPHGLGVHFIRTIMDSWEYDESFTPGNLLRLTKKLPPSVP